jgi:hypothetical protein
VQHLEQQRSELEITVNSAPDILVVPEEANSRPDLTVKRSVLDGYAQAVQALLKAWDFPRSERVFFDSSLNDLVIDGQPRASRGKGLRAITHAAMSVGLMEFCRERNLSHPGFVVLDSPLLAYYEPEGAEDEELAGSDLKERFYEYLAKNLLDAQVIVVENQHPPESIKGDITFTDFTKNPQEGRYGFFPITG